MRGSPRYYCAPAKLLTDTRFIRGPGVRFRSEARNFGGSPGLGRAGPPGPGCLTSESEERETWTAESLRAVGLRGATRVNGGRTRLRRYTFQVNTIVVQAAGRAGEQSRARLRAHAQEWDLVKRSDQPGKVLIQLESLILAQSERWRQA